MIALKNTTDNQIFYIIHKKIDGETQVYGLTSLDVEYTENGQYSVNPPSGYDGLSSVNVTVDVDKDCNLTTSTVTITGDGEHTIAPPEGYDGFTEVIVNVENGCDDRYDEGVADQKAKLTSATFTQNGSYTREDGWNAVEVDVDTVTPYNNGKQDGIDEQKAKLTSGTFTQNGTYTREDGYNEVVIDVDTVTPYNEGVADQKAKLTDITIVSNGRYTREDGYDDITVNVPSNVNNQNKQVTYTQNGTQTVIADNGYSGLGQVAVTVNVDTQTPYNNGKQDGIDEQKAKIDSITITQNGTYSDPDGYSPVIVNVDTVTPYNNGFNDGVNDQKSKLTTGTFTSNGTYTRADGYDEVVVNVPSGVNNQNKTANPSTSQQVITADQGYSGLGQVTLNAVTSSIDPNIDPGNIKDGVTILGVTGTYDPQPDLEAKSVTYTTNNTYTVTPSSGKDGLSSVQVSVNVDTQTPYDNGYAQGEADQKAKLGEIVITSNGIYTAADGFGRVVVNVNNCPDEIMLSADDILANLDGGDYPLAIYSSDDWTISDLPAWVSVDTDAGNAGLSTVIVTIDPSSNDRQAHFTISNGSLTEIVHITQRDTSYLTIEAINSGTLSFKCNNDAIARTIEYSLDNAATWNSVRSTTSGARIANLNAGDKVLLRGNNAYYAYDAGNYYGVRYNCFVTSSSFRYNVYGRIMSLIGTNDLVSGTNDFAFRSLFWGTGAVSAENLILPNSVSVSCYEDMFFNCTSLVKAPVLPATVMAKNCYNAMFNNTGLTQAPALPAMTLAEGCYRAMFSDCSLLSVVPELPAMVMAPDCYYSMFDGNDSLITPQATLPATTLATRCYAGMFSNCDHMTSVPTLPATTLAQNCYNDMFFNCRSITTAPDLPATSLVTGCYAYMFSGCRSLQSIKCLATSKSGTRCTYEWVKDVYGRGTFTKADTNMWARGVDGIPDNWTVTTV